MTKFAHLRKLFGSIVIAIIILVIAFVVSWTFIVISSVVSLFPLMPLLGLIVDVDAIGLSIDLDTASVKIIVIGSAIDLL